MQDTLIHFESIEWDRSTEGVEQKVYTVGSQRLRLIRFTDSFVENEWCNKGHVGYVLEGEMDIDFNGEIKSYQKGDGVWINEGVAFKHKVIIESGKTVELILFEAIE